ncbi:MAG TPA: V-type ATP synthase subunit D [Kiritimatiellia bacterium]|nr:V-type ATP synthase subunit D [Kiritimatiellia bacterium]HRZ11121.1 V-type ATP synthase subunit D [Kiritimatiellia bacterium]HSA19507.1 V-type ATP synthase subunit D [Kiritimatiellia bacterium]
MPRIKHTKNELKAQRDALKRFERYLPTLQLKKQQLQMEVRRLEGQIEQKRGEEEERRDGLKTWVRLFADAFPFGQYLKVAKVRASEGNIAGIAIPVLEEVRFERKMPDLFLTASWVDDGLEVLEQLLRLGIERRILDEQHRRLAEELRVTSQRVNLFEKVKIPECGENIRVIRIFLGDEQTADVVRGKIAKGRTVTA